MDILSSQMPTSNIVGSVEEAQARAMLIVTIEVGKELLNDNAMLLPSIQEQYNRHVNALIIGKKLNIQTQMEGSVSRWILSDLTASLQHHIKFVRKFVDMAP